MRCKAIANRIISEFPPLPVPKYPPGMGLDPFGNDEYAGFAGVPWPEVPPILYSSFGYDISPVIGFSFSEYRHMWNYHLPGFLIASLQHETETELTDDFLSSFSRITPKPNLNPQNGWSWWTWRRRKQSWWAGNDFHSNYTPQQCQVVVEYLEFMRDHGSNSPHEYEWTSQDNETFAKWINLSTS